MKNEFYVLNLADLDTFIYIFNGFKDTMDYEEVKNTSINHMINIMKQGVELELEITYKLSENNYDLFNDKYNKIIEKVDSYADYFQREDVIESKTLLNDCLRKYAYFNSNDYEEFIDTLKKLEQTDKKNIDKIVLISDACTSYSRTSTYQEFEKYYQENTSIKEQDTVKKMEDRFARHRAYLKSSTVDEFRTNLEEEYSDKTAIEVGSRLMVQRMEEDRNSQNKDTKRAIELGSKVLVKRNNQN